MIGDNYKSMYDSQQCFAIIITLAILMILLDVWIGIKCEAGFWFWVFVGSRFVFLMAVVCLCYTEYQNWHDVLIAFVVISPIFILVALCFRIRIVQVSMRRYTKEFK